jgi:hypothetical protein
MSFHDAAGIVIGAEIFALLLGWLIFVYNRKIEGPSSQPEDWGTNPDDRQWDKEAAAISHGELAAVRESAKNWAASIAALLTIGGTVGLVKGEEAFSKLTPGEGNFAFWLTLTAVVMTGLGIALATFAAQGTPSRYRHLDGWTLSKVSSEQSLKAMRFLLYSRILVVVATIAVLTTLAISWKKGIASEEPAAGGVSAMVTTEDGRSRCGELRTASIGGLWLVSGKFESPVKGGSEVMILDACPPPRR